MRDEENWILQFVGIKILHMTRFNGSFVGKMCAFIALHSNIIYIYIYIYVYVCAAIS